MDFAFFVQRASLSICAWFLLGMDRVKLIAKALEAEDSSALIEDQLRLSEGEKEISQVDVDPSELMGGHKKLETTLMFGRSLVTEDLINSYVAQGYFIAGVCRAPGVEETPDPRDGECVVFRDFIIYGLRFPLDPLLLEIFAHFGVKIHHLTPNAIVQLLKFFWVVKTFEGPISVDAFCRHYEMHSQGRKLTFEDEDKVYPAQSDCFTFLPRRNNKAWKIE